jgi:hypothetical protein
MSSSVQVIGLDETLRLLRDTEKEVYSDLIKNIKTLVEPARSNIVTSVPFLPPLSGMLHRGRTGWTGIEAKTEVTPFGLKGGAGGRRVVSIGVYGKPGAGFEIADMAGRKSQVGRVGLSREYTRNGRTMRHRLNGQGTALIRNLPNKASRYAYPAVEEKFPVIQAGILAMLDVTAAKINRRLDRI